MEKIVMSEFIFLSLFQANLFISKSSLTSWLNWVELHSQKSRKNFVSFPTGRHFWQKVKTLLRLLFWRRTLNNTGDRTPDIDLSWGDAAQVVNALSESELTCVFISTLVKSHPLSKFTLDPLCNSFCTCPRRPYLTLLYQWPPREPKKLWNNYQAVSRT